MRFGIGQLSGVKSVPPRDSGWVSSFLDNWQPNYPSATADGTDLMSQVEEAGGLFASLIAGGDARAPSR